MQCIIPSTLKFLEGTTVPEADAPLWSETATYAEGSTVIRKHYVYKAVKDVLAGVDPETNCNGTDAAWAYQRITNLYASIDNYSTTKTVAPVGQTTMTLKLPFTPPDSAIALLGMSATHISVTMDTATERMYEYTAELVKDSGDWWDYCFGPFRYQRDAVLVSVPPVPGTVTITLDGGASPPEIGLITIGQWVRFGDTEYGARSGFVDYSVIEDDAYGNVNFVPRDTAPYMSAPVYIDPNDITYVRDILKELAGKPALWIGGDGAGLSDLVVYGFLQKYDGTADNYGKISANFEIKGIK